VDPVMKADTPLYTYEPHSWGPKEADALAPPGGWVEPLLHADAADTAAHITAHK